MKKKLATKNHKSKKPVVLKESGKKNHSQKTNSQPVARTSRLGRGLSVLFGEDAAGAAKLADSVSAAEVLHADDDTTAGQANSDTKSLLQLPIKKIVPGRLQARTHFNQEKIDELATSIKRHGIIEPLVVRQHEDGYEIIAGERRFRAAKKLGLSTVPALLRREEETLSQEVMLVENIQREDLTAIEEAKGFHAMIKGKNLTQAELASALGKSRSYVANALRLLTLPKWMLEKVDKGELVAGVARALVGLDQQQQKAVVKKIQAEKLNAREVEQMIARLKNTNGKSVEKNTNVRKQPPTSLDKLNSQSLRDADLLLMEDQLREALKTKVRLKQLRGGVGRLEIEYYSYDELQELLVKLKK